MKKEDVLNHLATPLLASAVPRTGHRFFRRDHLFIIYKTDIDALRKVVPEPLELLDEPLVRFEVMSMPDATGFGSYTECGQAIPVSFKGVEGEYLHMMYLDNFEATASGREVHAYPKKMGWPSLFVDDNTLVGTLDYGRHIKQRVATATMTYKFQALPEEAALQQLTGPVYMLKLMPNYDGSPRIAELTETRTPAENIDIIEAWTGDARLQLFDHVNCPLNDLPVKEIVSCSEILTNLTLGQPKVIYDYLK